MTKASGLRNRRRSGRSTYSRAGKAKLADRYGRWENGTCKVSEQVGRRLRSVDSVEVEIELEDQEPRIELRLGGRRPGLYVDDERIT